MFELKINLKLSAELRNKILNAKNINIYKGVTGIIKLKNKYVFIINEKEPYNKEWIFVSGSVEENENSEDAIKREILEETGLIVINKSKIGTLIVENIPGNQIDVFTCECEGKITLGKNIKCIGVFDKENFPNNLNQTCMYIINNLSNQ